MQRTRATLVTLGIANMHACIRSLRNASKVRGMHRRERSARSISPSPFLPRTYAHAIPFVQDIFYSSPNRRFDIFLMSKISKSRLITDTVNTWKNNYYMIKNIAPMIKLTIIRAHAKQQSLSILNVKNLCVWQGQLSVTSVYNER